MKIIKLIMVFVCAALFAVGITATADGVDARECRRMAGILFLGGLFFGPAMYMAEGFMRWLARYAVHVIHGHRQTMPRFASVPTWLVIGSGAACLSNAVGCFVGIIWNGTPSFWAGLVPAGFGCGLLAGVGACRLWLRGENRAKKPDVSGECPERS